MSEENFKKRQARYVTRGINERLSVSMQIILWDLIDELKKVKKLDYLQIFELETIGSQIEGNLIQVITHSQEQPKYRKIWYIPTMEEGMTGKIYIIDDGEYATMLWADEY